MADRHWHKIYTDQYEQAVATAHGTILGWTTGNGEQPPHLTAVLVEAYRRAFAEAFNAGYDTARQDVTT